MNQHDTSLRSLVFACALAALTVCAGCGKQPTAAVEKGPRPVSVITLKSGIPSTSRQASASVSSWKTEQIGFEVGGRVSWVLEPGQEIEGRIFDLTGNPVTPGTALAQVDKERFELALGAAKAEVEVAELQKQSIDVNLNSGIPADIEAAKADLELAQVEYDRNKRLVAQNATAQADLDRSAAELRTSNARIATLEAQTKQTEAELQSALASIKQAEQNYKDAQRNLADTTLYSSFRGQVADVHVVPGSVVSQGSPVLTIQMMDPIKVEVELSAALSRTIRKRNVLPVYITMQDGSVERREGYVYTVSPSADPSTRTFTLTLLVLNEKVAAARPDGFDDENMARTPDIWRMDFEFLPDLPAGTFFIEKKAICQDEQGYYVWKCLNAQVYSDVPELLEVAKMRVTPGDLSLPFLGNWVFQTVTIQDSNFNPKTDLFVGELLVDSGSANDWDGTKVMVDRGGQWMLRPGDLVSVDLSESDTTPGFHIPMEAIYEESGETYVFIAETSDEKTIARRIQVGVLPADELGVGTLRQIIPKMPEDLSEGMLIIAGGVHFLHDGDLVRIAERN
ncbi:MAG: HlyD family efflux transporter periplasmic adaptor subunit [Planctomycetota bacterium]